MVFAFLRERKQVSSSTVLWLLRKKLAEHRRGIIATIPKEVSITEQEPRGGILRILVNVPFKLGDMAHENAPVWIVAAHVHEQLVPIGVPLNRLSENMRGIRVPAVANETMNVRQSYESVVIVGKAQATVHLRSVAVPALLEPRLRLHRIGGRVVRRSSRTNHTLGNFNRNVVRAVITWAIIPCAAKSPPVPPPVIVIRIPSAIVIVRIPPAPRSVVPVPGIPETESEVVIGSPVIVVRPRVVIRCRV